MAYGPSFRDARVKKLNISQRALAERVNVDASVITKIEKEQAFPSHGLVSRLAKEFKIPFEDLWSQVERDRIRTKMEKLRQKHFFVNNQEHPNVFRGNGDSSINDSRKTNSENSNDQQNHEYKEKEMREAFELLMQSDESFSALYNVVMGMAQFEKSR